MTFPLQVSQRDKTGSRVVLTVSSDELRASAGGALHALEGHAVAALAAVTPDNELVISVPAQRDQGFGIEIVCKDGAVHAAFGGLKVLLRDLRVALIWLRRALSKHYHLRTVYVGTRACEWALEPVHGSAGGEDVLSAKLLVSVPGIGLRRSRAEYQQN